MFNWNDWNHNVVVLFRSWGCSPHLTSQMCFSRPEGERGCERSVMRPSVSRPAWMSSIYRKGTGGKKGQNAENVCCGASWGWSSSRSVLLRGRRNNGGSVRMMEESGKVRIPIWVSVWSFEPAWGENILPEAECGTSSTFTITDIIGHTHTHTLVDHFSFQDMAR